MPVSLSTSWCSGRHRDGYEMVKEMVDLGFEYIELSHGIRVSLVPGILQAVHEKIVKISSVHNFCPLPNGIQHPAPNLFKPSALGSQESHLWLRHTRRTFEFAERMKAPLVVTHLGSIDFPFWSPVGKLERMRERVTGDIHADARYQELLEKTRAKLKKRMPKFWAQVLRNLERVLSTAEENRVKIGVENREGIEELPLDDDFSELFSELSSTENVGYWHDAGHAQIKEWYGLAEHETLLLENGHRLLGFHLHDVSREGKDHQPLGTGVVDFEMIAKYIRPEHALILEFSPALRPEEVLESKAFLEALLARRTA